MSLSADTLKVLACQVAVPPTICAEDRDRHVARTAALVAAHLEREGADLVVLPELSSIDYSRAAFDRLDQIAEAADGASCSVWRGVARRFGVAVVFGIARRHDSGYRISQVAVGPDGELIGHFDKIHVAQFGASMEKEYFDRSDFGLVFAFRGFRISPIICYDIRIPELTRKLCTAHGAELILHCGAYARDPSCYSWHHFAVARALENQVYLLSLNRAGEDFGASLFCPPWVDGTQPATVFGNAETLQMFTLDKAVIKRARETYPFLADRLDDYDAMTVLSKAEAGS